MLVSLERSGGFTGRRVTSSIDTDELPAPQVTEALHALDELGVAPPAAPAGGASQPRYRLTVHRESGPQVVELLESQIPAALRPMLAELMKRGTPAP
jgi:hypothetical protein